MSGASSGNTGYVLGDTSPPAAHIFDHAARAKFSGIGKPSAKSLNSNGRDAYTSAAIVVAEAWLGHKNIQHTVRYTELAPDRFRDFWR
jgi:hypothetical protein